MRKPLLKALIIFSLILTVFTACDHNVYMGDITKDVWEVKDKTFYKFSDALSYYLSTLGSKAITENDVITLIRDVPASERGEGIVIPDSFPAEGNLRVDFNGHEYWFFDNLEYFFEIRHGDTIEIINGTTVIDVPANPVPKALVVNTKTVTIDDHLIDDRRPVPKAVDVQENGILRVISTSSSTQNALKGEVTVAGGGQLNVDGGFIEATTIDVSTEESWQEGKVNLTAGYIFISKTLSINTNGKVYVSGGIISTDTIRAASTESEQKAEFHLTGGDLNTANLNAGNNSIINISQPDAENPSQAFIENTAIDSGASFTVSDGDVTFRTSIEKDNSGSFEISGGNIHNPHNLTPEVSQAITAGGGTETTTNIVIHEPLEAHAKKEPTCTEDGYEAYWICKYDGCGRWFNDENCIHENTSRTPVVIPAIGHDLKHHDAVAPTCTTDGNIEYWHCLRCLKYFADEACTDEKTVDELIINKLGHNMSHVDAVPPTCTADGILEHYHCSRCEKNFEDEDGTHEMSTVVDPALGHTPVHNPAVAPTCTEDGNIEYWQCERCLKYFADEACTQEKTAEQVVIPALGHNWSEEWTFDDDIDEDHHWHECTRCHVINEESIEDHVFEIVFDADISARKLSIESYCTTCKKRYVNVIPSATGAFDISMSIGIDVVRTAPGVNEWTISVKDSVKEANKNNTCTWYSQSGVELSGLYGTDPITVSISDEVEPGNYQIRCEFYDSNDDYRDMCILVLHK